MEKFEKCSLLILIHPKAFMRTAFPLRPKAVPDFAFASSSKDFLICFMHIEFCPQNTRSLPKCFLETCNTYCGTSKKEAPQETATSETPTMGGWSSRDWFLLTFRLSQRLLRLSDRATFFITWNNDPTEPDFTISVFDFQNPTKALSSQFLEFPRLNEFPTEHLRSPTPPPNTAAFWRRVKPHWILSTPISSQWQRWPLCCQGGGHNRRRNSLLGCIFGLGSLLKLYGIKVEG